MPDTSDSEALRSILNGRPPGPASTPARSPASVPNEPEAKELTIEEKNDQNASVCATDTILTRLHIVDRAGKVRTFQYQFLDVESTFDGGTFALIFVGERKHWQVVVKGYGPKFWSVYDFITLHRLPYLREATGSMPEAQGNAEAVITEIKITDVTPK